MTDLASAIAPPAQGVTYAGFWRRSAAWLIDLVVTLCISAAVGFVFEGVMMFVEGLLGVHFGEAIPLTSAVLGLFAAWLYYSWMESSSKQATLGKLAIGIIVTDERGNRPDFGRASFRFWGKVASSYFYGVGFLVATVTERKQALHDRLSHCLVVKR